MDPISFLWGAALGVIGAFGAGFLKKAGEDCYSWVRKKINPKAVEPHPPHLIIHMNNESVSNTADGILSAEPQRPVIERLSAVGLDEINTAIVDAPPLQRDRVAESYVGLRVEWETEFVSGRVSADGGSIRLHLTVPDAKHQPKSVWCDVSTSDYRELGILPEGAKVRVSGEIQQVVSYGVDLKDARLHFYGNHRGA